jgi:hypothetical protein
MQHWRGVCFNLTMHCKCCDHIEFIVTCNFNQYLINCYSVWKHSAVLQMSCHLQTVQSLTKMTFQTTLSKRATTLVCCMYLTLDLRTYWDNMWQPFYRHIEVSTGPSQHYVFTVRFYSDVPRGTVGFSLPQRKWATLSLNQDIEVKPYHFDPTSSSECLCTIVLEADFLQKKRWVCHIILYSLKELNTISEWHEINLMLTYMKH